MSSVKVETREQFKAYQERGDYQHSIDDVAERLNIGITKAKTLLKDMPRIELSGQIYHEHKKELQTQGNSKAYRTYYNVEEVINILIDRGNIQAWYGDLREVISKHGGKGVNGEGEEIKIDKDFLKIMPVTFYLRLSRNIHDIVIEDKGYRPYTISNENEHLYINDKKDIRTYKELTDKKDIVKYKRMMMRDFYMKFSVGSVDDQGEIKRGKHKYLQSIRRQQDPNLSENIRNLINWYEGR